MLSLTAAILVLHPAASVGAATAATAALHVVAKGLHAKGPAATGCSNGTCSMRPNSTFATMQPVTQQHGLSSNEMALITSECGATCSLGIKWP